MAISVLGIYARELKTHIHPKTRTQIFRATLFIITPKRKWPKYPPSDKWIKQNAIYPLYMIYMNQMYIHCIYIIATSCVIQLQKEMKY